MRHLVLAALFAAAPALAAEPAPPPTTVAGPEEAPPAYGPVDRPALHVPPAEMDALLPDEHAGLVELQKMYADFCDETLGEDEGANIELLTTVKPAELDALTAKGMEIVGAGGHDTPSAAVFVLASARLAYADLAYSMRPTARMKEKQAAAFWKVLHTEVWPGFAPVDVEARAYLGSIVKGAREGSPWRDHSTALLAKMDANARGISPPAP